jgi:hypothetical protein
MRSSFRNIILFGGKSLDPDAKAFAAASGATDVARISTFVKAVKALGAWNNATFWPQAAGISAQTGTTVHALGGVNEAGTLVNGPAWTSGGITYDNSSSHRMDTSAAYGTAPFQSGVVSLLVAGSGSNQIELTEGLGSTPRGSCSVRPYAGNNWNIGLPGVANIFINSSFTAKNNTERTHWMFGMLTGTTGFLAQNGGSDTGSYFGNTWDNRNAAASGIRLQGTLTMNHTVALAYVIRGSTVSRSALHTAISDFLEGPTFV